MHKKAQFLTLVFTVLSIIIVIGALELEYSNVSANQSLSLFASSSSVSKALTYNALYESNLINAINPTQGAYNAYVSFLSYFNTNFIPSYNISGGGNNVGNSYGYTSFYYTLPITINSGNDISSVYQQRIVLNSSIYSKYENASLNNVQFTYTNGSVIPSWLESGNLAEFNGNDSWINGTGKSGLAGMKSLTVSGWLYTTNLSHVNVLVHKESSYVLYITKSQIDFVVSNGTYSWLYTDAQSFNFKPYTWYLLTGTWNGTQINIYINGQKIGSPLTTPVFTISPDSNEVDIGVWGTWNLKVGGSIEQGYMANVQIYNSSLDEGQVSGLYADGMAASPIGGQDLLAWWPLAGNSLDSSGNGFNGVENNINFDAPGSASTATTYYIKLPGILANISETIDARIYRYSSTLNSFNTGEAPEFSQVYGQYDDGAEVFNFYENFEGNSLPSGLSATDAAGASVNNGLELSAGSVYTNTAVFSSLNNVEEMYAEYTTLNSANYTGIMQSNSQAPQGGNAGSNAEILWMTNNLVNSYYAWSGNGGAASYNLQNGLSSPFTPSLNKFYIIGSFVNGSKIGEQVNYVNELTAVGTYNTNQYVILGYFIGKNSGTEKLNPIKINWIRVRAYPPNGIMPSVSFGTLI